MPNPQYPYTYFNPSKKEQIALGAGSLISALLGAASGQNGSDAAVRGLAGLTGGYGAGYQNYQDLMNTAFQRDMGEKKYNQGIREYEEVEKPYKQAWIDNMSARSSPEDIQYENEKRALDIKNKRLDIRGKSKELRLGKSPLVSVNTGAFETEEQKGMGRVAVGNYENIQKDAASARNELDIYNELESLMSQTDTGALEPFKTSLVSYSQSLGIPTSEKWDANQAIEAISNKLTIMARKAGEGQILAGQISDSDREFLKASVPSLGKMPGSNKLLIEMNKKLAQRKIESAKFAEDYYRKNGTLKGMDSARDEWVNKNPLFATTGVISNMESAGSQTVNVNGVNYIIKDGKVYQP